MKTKAKILILSLLFGGMTAMYSCGDDSEGPSGSELCNVEACAGDSDEAIAFQSVCIKEYNNCIATGKKSQEECAALATETCTL